MRTIPTIVTLVCLSGGTALAGDTKAGKAAYDKACQSCHGADGTPKDAIAKMMKVEMKDLKSAKVQAMSDEEIKKIITGGKGKMKPSTSASGAALDDITAYLRMLKK